MSPFSRPRLPDRQALQQYISVLQPRAGRILGALGGMMVAGPAWLYGLCVGLLLGHMVDTVRAKTTAGSAGTGTDSTADESASGEPVSGKPIDEEQAPYQLLGLQPGASTAEVKKAWRTQSRQAHPDAPGGAAEDFMALKTAYEKIMEHRKSGPARQ